MSSTVVPSPSSPSGEFDLPESQTSLERVGTTRRKEPRRSVKKSLIEILRQHAGTSLFVLPMQWTDLHSQLLGARFIELPPCNTPLPESTPGLQPSQGHLHPSITIETLSSALTNLLNPETSCQFQVDDFASTVLQILWPSAFQSEGDSIQHLFYGDRAYRDAIRAGILWNRPEESALSIQSSFSTVSTLLETDLNNNALASTPPPHDPSGLPMICYIAKSKLAWRRKCLFRRAPSRLGRPNDPVRRLLELRTKALQPANSDHDPVLVAMFLAMAQRHFYGPPSATMWLPSRAPRQRPPFEDLRLRILTHDNDTAEFIVYTGHVTASFLDRFYYPSKAPVEEDGDQSSGMKIEYTRVPIWPILGLRERLGKALGEEIVGPFDATKMETWLMDEVVDKVQSTKRERDDDVFEDVNRELTEETQYEEQSQSLWVSVPQKKRRRLEVVDIMQPTKQPLWDRVFQKKRRHLEVVDIMQPTKQPLWDSVPQKKRRRLEVADIMQCAKRKRDDDVSDDVKEKTQDEELSQSFRVSVPQKKRRRRLEGVDIMQSTKRKRDDDVSEEVNRKHKEKTQDKELSQSFYISFP
ncbi:hypothetical protein E4U55_004129 [Claviceps digitariae]|nr:hypothetical protein E4U55_004129 [Claviceps digitariae]